MSGLKKITIHTLDGLAEEDLIIKSLYFFTFTFIRKVFVYFFKGKKVYIAIKIDI